MTAQHKNYNVVIVGGGIVGLTLANMLAASDFSVAVIERSPPVRVTTGKATDIRVSAINRAAVRAFSAMQVWPHLHQRYCACQQMHVRDSTGTGQIHFDAADSGLSELNFIVENSILVQALRLALEPAKNIQIYCPHTIESITRTDERLFSHSLTLDDGLQLTTSLLVAADGAGSGVRDNAGINFVRRSYHQQGLVCTVATEKSHQQAAWQCFQPTGPLAFLPLFNARSSIVWSLDDDRAQQLMALNDEDFRLALAQASDYQLGRINAVSERKLFPLAHGHASTYVQHGLALVGDAAHSIHPLAGQGANLGIADAICLAEVIQQAKKANRQWFAQHILLKYQRQRKRENRLMENAMTGFKVLFGQDNPLLAECRSVGLNLVDHLPLIKNRFIRQALGG